MTIYRGGKDEERLYLYDSKFDCGDDVCIVRHTDMPQIAYISARHKGRYCIPAMFCRPGWKVLDFPCGSGYGSEIFEQVTSVQYEGRDSDLPTLEYAKNFYRGAFLFDDLREPHLSERYYNLIACVEGLEHIEHIFQSKLIKYFFDALVQGGILTVTTPEKKEETTNQYHKHELTKNEFSELLNLNFLDVQMLSIKDTLHNGVETNLLWGICQK